MSESIQAPQDNRLLVDARKIIDTARANAVRSVDFNRVMMYWNLGKRIFEEEQQGRDRAEYGAKMLQNLAETLVVEYGSGFSYRQLAFSRQFYRFYPIVNTLYSQLNWSQYKLLISMYKLHLPTEEQLLLEVRKATEEYEEAARRRRDSE